MKYYYRKHSLFCFLSLTSYALDRGSTAIRNIWQPCTLPHCHPGHSPRRWRQDCHRSATSPRAKEEAPACAMVELPQRGTAVLAASLHPTPPFVIHSPVPTGESYDVPCASWPVDWSALGRTAVAALPLLVGGGIHSGPPPPLVS
jgi:hypothetical protein